MSYAHPPANTGVAPQPQPQPPPTPGVQHRNLAWLQPQRPQSGPEAGQMMLYGQQQGQQQPQGQLPQLPAPPYNPSQAAHPSRAPSIAPTQHSAPTRTPSIAPTQHNALWRYGQDMPPVSQVYNQTAADQTAMTPYNRNSAPPTGAMVPYDPQVGGTVAPSNQQQQQQQAMQRSQSVSHRPPQLQRSPTNSGALAQQGQYALPPSVGAYGQAPSQQYGQPQQHQQHQYTPQTPQPEQRGPQLNQQFAATPLGQQAQSQRYGGPPSGMPPQQPGFPTPGAPPQQPYQQTYNTHTIHPRGHSYDDTPANNNYPPPAPDPRAPGQQMGEVEALLAATNLNASAPPSAPGSGQTAQQRDELQAKIARQMAKLQVEMAKVKAERNKPPPQKLPPQQIHVPLQTHGMDMRLPPPDPVYALSQQPAQLNEQQPAQLSDQQKAEMAKIAVQMEKLSAGMKNIEAQKQQSAAQTHGAIIPHPSLPASFTPSISSVPPPAPPQGFAEQQITRGRGRGSLPPLHEDDEWDLEDRYDQGFRKQQKPRGRGRDALQRLAKADEWALQDGHDQPTRPQKDPRNTSNMRLGMRRTNPGQQPTRSGSRPVRLAYNPPQNQYQPQTDSRSQKLERIFVSQHVCPCNMIDLIEYETKDWERTLHMLKNDVESHANVRVYSVQLARTPYRSLNAFNTNLTEKDYSLGYAITVLKRDYRRVVEAFQGYARDPYAKDWELEHLECTDDGEHWDLVRRYKHNTAVCSGLLSHANCARKYWRHSYDCRRGPGREYEPSYVDPEDQEVVDELEFEGMNRIRRRRGGRGYDDGHRYFLDW